MPTGYTSKIYDGTETTLRQFALRCARGMGALITMRDDPMDAAIPQRLEADTAYYDKQITRAEARIAELRAMTDEECDAAAEKFNAELVEHNRKRVEDNDALRARYDALIAETEAWEGAPEGLKDLMLDQLRESREFDVSPDPLRYAGQPRTGVEWMAAELENAARELRYGIEGRDGEIARTQGRNEWLAQLHAALPAA